VQGGAAPYNNEYCCTTERFNQATFTRPGLAEGG
jgi:hypothetical protein